MILINEIIAVCLLFTLMEVWGTKKNPLIGLHKMPVELQERAAGTYPIRMDSGNRGYEKVLSGLCFLYEKYSRKSACGTGGSSGSRMDHRIDWITG